jgi:hypothetical protein
VDCSPVSSTSTSGTDDALAWLVIVECDDGSRHEVKVHLAGAALSPPSDSVADIRQSEGKSAVLAALAADPTRVPTQIICSREGCQPEYGDPLASP